MAGLARYRTQFLHKFFVFEATSLFIPITFWFLGDILIGTGVSKPQYEGHYLTIFRLKFVVSTLILVVLVLSLSGLCSQFSPMEALSVMLLVDVAYTANAIADAEVHDAGIRLGRETGNKVNHESLSFCSATVTIFSFRSRSRQRKRIDGRTLLEQHVYRKDPLALFRSIIAGREGIRRKSVAPLAGEEQMARNETLKQKKRKWFDQARPHVTWKSPIVGILWMTASPLCHVLRALTAGDQYTTADIGCVIVMAIVWFTFGFGVSFLVLEWTSGPVAACVTRMSRVNCLCINPFQRKLEDADLPFLPLNVVENVKLWLDVHKQAKSVYEPTEFRVNGKSELVAPNPVLIYACAGYAQTL